MAWAVAARADAEAGRADAARVAAAQARSLAGTEAMEEGELPWVLGLLSASLAEDDVAGAQALLDARLPRLLARARALGDPARIARCLSAPAFESLRALAARAGRDVPAGGHETPARAGGAPGRGVEREAHGGSGTGAGADGGRSPR